MNAILEPSELGLQSIYDISLCSNIPTENDESSPLEQSDAWSSYFDSQSIADEDDSSQYGRSRSNSVDTVSFTDQCYFEEDKKLVDECYLALETIDRNLEKINRKQHFLPILKRMQEIVFHNPANKEENQSEDLLNTTRSLSQSKVPPKSIEAARKAGVSLRDSLARELDKEDKRNNDNARD